MNLHQWQKLGGTGVRVTHGPTGTAAAGYSPPCHGPQPSPCHPGLPEGSSSSRKLVLAAAAVAVFFPLRSPELNHNTPREGSRQPTVLFFFFAHKQKSVGKGWNG